MARGAAGRAAAGGGGVRGYLAGAVRQIFAPIHPRGEVRFAEQAFAGDAVPLHGRRPRAPRWGHVQAADERDEVVGGDTPLGPRATELQDLHEGPEDV